MMDVFRRHGMTILVVGAVGQRRGLRAEHTRLRTVFARVRG
jgi:hypothetical protein